jgi:hypothetical protein
MIAHEEGRHRGYKEDLSYGRRLGFDEGRSGPIRYNGISTRRIPRRAVQPDGEEEDESVHSERNDVLLQPQPPPQSSSRSRQYVATYTCAILLIFLLSACVPTLRPLCRFQHWFPQSYPRLRRMSLHQDEPGHHLRQKRPRILYPCASRPVLHLATPSAYLKMAGSRKRADPHTSYIPVPPPHDLSQPIPPSRSSRSHELDNHVRQTMFAAEDSSYALVRTRDFAYTQPAALPVPRPRTPSLISKSSMMHVSV